MYMLHVFKHRLQKHLKSGRAPLKRALSTMGCMCIYFALELPPPPPPFSLQMDATNSVVFNFCIFWEGLTNVLNIATNVNNWHYSVSKGGTLPKKKGHIFLFLKNKGAPYPSPPMF